MNTNPFTQRHPLKSLLVFATTAGVCSLALATKSYAALTFTQCTDTPDFQCATLDVPLDRSGTVPGTISLKIKRKVSGPAPASTAVIALAGGPGQAALPFVSSFAEELKPALVNRDLLIFDQRGTGKSNPLHCAAANSSSIRSLPELAQTCANQIGPARAFFRTVDSIDDINAIREAAGYEKVFLDGTSYGTKVAIDYASKYPNTVEKLILDSTYLGDDVFSRSSFRAITRIIGELCYGNACPASSVSDIVKVARRFAQKSLRITTPLANGSSFKIPVSQIDLFENILSGGDLNEVLRAMTPAAFHSAARGDLAPLGRLASITRGLNARQKAVEDADSEFSFPLFVATTCEEAPNPWDRFAAQPTKQQQLQSAINALTDQDFFPFVRSAAKNSAVELCLGWPTASPAPQSLGTPANVPTLVLSGRQDIRTPLEEAQRIPGILPQAAVVDVPYVGHSVSGSDVRTSCSKNAVTAFAEGRPVSPCTTVKRAFVPPPALPTTVDKVKPRGAKGKAGKIVNAAVSTVLDTNNATLTTIFQNGAVPSQIGGLRSGSVLVRNSSTSLFYTLRRVVTIKGVIVSGLVTNRSGKFNFQLRISGSAGKGNLTLSRNALRGTINGRKVRASFIAAKDRSLFAFKNLETLLRELRERRSAPNVFLAQQRALRK